MYYLFCQNDYASSIASAQSLQEGEEFSVKITAVDSPVNFWCQIQSEDTKTLYNELKGKLDI